MENKFNKSIDFDKLLLDGEGFQIQRTSDHVSYKEFVKYFKELKNINLHNLIIGINFTYGWMPTIFDFRSDSFDDAIDVLNKAKLGKMIEVKDLVLLKGLFNNSLVGTSKILHFINPSKFAIWDSRVYRYLTGKEPNQNRIGDCNLYLDYLIFCDNLNSNKNFSVLQEIIEKKVGYKMTPMRVTELIMYSKGAKNNNK
jgi:hypothetical protein